MCQNVCLSALFLSLSISFYLFLSLSISFYLFLSLSIRYDISQVFQNKKIIKSARRGERKPHKTQTNYNKY